MDAKCVKISTKIWSLELTILGHPQLLEVRGYHSVLSLAHGCEEEGFGVYQQIVYKYSGIVFFPL